MRALAAINLMCFRRGRAGAAAAPCLDLVLRVYSSQHYASFTVGATSRACMREGGRMWGTPLHACSVVSSYMLLRAAAAAAA